MPVHEPKQQMSSLIGASPDKKATVGARSGTAGVTAEKNELCRQPYQVTALWSGCSGST